MGFRNIFACTVLLLAAGLSDAAVIADSSADFSGTQGAKNWYYGYFPNGNINAFTQLSTFNTQLQRWQHTVASPPWTVVGGGSSIHPNGTNSPPEEWAVREWVSNYSGDVTIGGHLAKIDTNSMNPGIFGRIYINHQLMYEQFIAGTDGTGVDYSLRSTLKAGDVLDFVVAANGIDFNGLTLFSSTIASVYDTVQVDFSAPAPVKLALGFLHGFDGSNISGPNPPNTSITPLQPRFWRGAPLLSQYQRIRSAMPSMMVDLILSDGYGYPPSYGGNGAPWLNFTAYETFVRNTLASFKPLPANVEFEVWNEPDDAQFASTDSGYQAFWNGARQQFYDTYSHAFQVIRSELGANALVAGPSFTTYNHAAIQDFLEYCLANACEVNSLTWHALDDSALASVPANVQDARVSFLQNPRYAPLRIMRIDVNEIVGSIFTHQPAGTLSAYGAFEASQADAAAKSCWPDSTGANECFNGTLDGLFTSGTFQPRSVWWAHKAYADGVPTRVSSSTSSSNLVALASSSGPSQAPQVLIGSADYTRTVNHQTGTATVQVALNNLNALPQFSNAPSVSVLVESIPDTGEAALTAPLAVGTLIDSVSRGAAKVTLPPLSLGGVYRLTIQPSTVPAPSMSLSQTSLNFDVSGSLATNPQSVTLTFANGSGLPWTASANGSNITVTPSSGTGNAILKIAATAGSSSSVTITAPNVSNSPQQIQVKIATTASSAPFGSFDTPADKTTGVSGAIAVTGWALDTVEVAKVDIWREPVGAEPANALVYIGDAVFVAGARPDVMTANPNLPFNYRAGWGYLMLTTSLPASGSGGTGNGTYKLHAIAHNAAGVTTDLGIKTITVDNAHSIKPFGSIDTPNQGATVSGKQFVNFGWALAQNPNCIATSGATMYVNVDGVTVGHPTYNQNRSDLLAQFPGRCNSMGAAGYYFIDTTQLSNGVHTISWVVYDDHGNGDGIGSRFFNVLNSGSGSTAAPAAAIEPVRITPGRVEIEEMGHVELKVGAISGYLSANGQRLPLPAGSTLKDGTFYWQLAPVFHGDYDLVFEHSDGAAAQVRVNVQPKTYHRDFERR